jgi:hypothetical protein
MRLLSSRLLCWRGGTQSGSRDHLCNPATPIRTGNGPNPTIAPPSAVALQMAHDLIHMIVTALLRRLEQKRFVFSVHRTDWVGNGPEVWGHRSNCCHRATWHKTKRPGLGLSHKALSRSALPQVLLDHRIKSSLLRVSGTEVPVSVHVKAIPRRTHAS